MANTHFKGPLLVAEGTSTFNALTLGSAGSAIKQIKTGSVTVDPTSLTTGLGNIVTATLTAVAAGDIVIASNQSNHWPWKHCNGHSHGCGSWRYCHCCPSCSWSYDRPCSWRMLCQRCKHYQD